VSETDDEERGLKMQQLRADIANKRADTDLKTAQTKWEPLKALSAAFAAGIAAATGLIALGAWMAGHLH